MYQIVVWLDAVDSGMAIWCVPLLDLGNVITVYGDIGRDWIERIVT